MSRFLKTVLVTVAGLVTSCATAALLALVERWTGFALFTFTIWVVLPGGAILSGFAAASGYYAGGRWLHVRPGGLLALQMILVAGATYLLIHYAEYASIIRSDGIALRDVLPFSAYLDFVLTHAHYRFTHGSAETGEVGRLGYWIGAIQFLGFLFGGAAVHFTLRARPWCARCERYLAGLGAVEQRFGSLEAAAQRAEALHAAPADTPAFAELCQPAGAGAPADGEGRVTIRLLACPACRTQWLQTELHVRRGRDWKDADGGKLVELSRGVDLRGTFGLRSDGAPRRMATG